MKDALNEVLEQKLRGWLDAGAAVVLIATGDSVARAPSTLDVILECADPVVVVVDRSQTREEQAEGKSHV